MQHKREKLERRRMDSEKRLGCLNRHWRVRGATCEYVLEKMQKMIYCCLCSKHLTCRIVCSNSTRGMILWADLPDRG